MDPISTIVEKKATESLWSAILGWWNRNKELQKQVEALKAQLAEERSGRIAFDRLMEQLECRPCDDNLYWKKDGTGGPYCPLCLHDQRKSIPLTHAAEGSFYCRLHDHYFETEERRERVRSARQQIRRRSYRGPHSWMR
jgi:hypothetical protein